MLSTFAGAEHLNQRFLGVLALAPEYAAAAAAWAARLGLPVGGDSPYLLQVGEDGLQFAENAVHAPGALRVDFLAGALAHRGRFGGGSGQMIARAVGLQPGVRPVVLDATAGLGRDGFVLAQLGCALTLIERRPVIAALLEDGLRRAANDAATAPIVARMRLLVGDAIEMMGAWLVRQEMPPQVVYLDPMFPQRTKSALVKKEMRALRPLAGDDADAPALLEAALSLASHRVVVKRPRQAPALDSRLPSHVLVGRSSRFDVYAKKSLKAV